MTLTCWSRSSTTPSPPTTTSSAPNVPIRRRQVTDYLRNGFFLLLEDTVGLLGLIYTELREDNRGYIGMIAIDPDRQGAGIGTRLRPDLVAWYQRKGYRVVGEAPYVRPEILVMPCHFILMEKTLAPTPTADPEPQLTPHPN
jgi:GNAT superfamily N-acetyltransferase